MAWHEPETGHRTPPAVCLAAPSPFPAAGRTCTLRLVLWTSIPQHRLLTASIHHSAAEQRTPGYQPSADNPTRVHPPFHGDNSSCYRKSLPDHIHARTQSVNAFAVSILLHGSTSLATFSSCLMPARRVAIFVASVTGTWDKNDHGPRRQPPRNRYPPRPLTPRPAFAPKYQNLR
jgi:hypothetical protein